MELSDRDVRNFVRVIMPELYRMQAAWDAWTDAIDKVCKASAGEEHGEDVTDESVTGDKHQTGA